MKPHIFRDKIGFWMWVCVGPETIFGVGETMVAAYAAWLGNIEKRKSWRRILP